MESSFINNEVLIGLAIVAAVVAVIVAVAVIAIWHKELILAAKELTLAAVALGVAALAVLFYIFGGSSNDDSDNDNKTQSSDSAAQVFLYQKHSIIDLADSETRENQHFYRFVAHNPDGNVSLIKSDCMQDNPGGYDFSGCANGSYYSISEQDNAQDLADDLNQVTEKSQKEASQVSEEISKQLLVLSDNISRFEVSIKHHDHWYSHHLNGESQSRSRLRQCPDIWIGLPFGRGFHIPDAGCHAYNSWQQAQIAHHKFWKDHHHQQKSNKQSQLLALQQERNELKVAQQQLNVAIAKLDSHMERLDQKQTLTASAQFDKDRLTLSADQLGQGIHWVNEYVVERTLLPGSEDTESDAGYLISIDCPLNPYICQTMQLNDAKYPVLFQHSINPLRTLDADIQYKNSPSPRWEWQVTDSKAMASSDFALSLSIFYDTSKQASGSGSSAGESQIITHGAFNHFKHSGGLKGRWHRGHLEVDEWGIAQWQRVEITDQHGWYFYKNPKLLFPDNFDGIGYHNMTRPSRLIDMHLIDLNEDGLDDLISVYSDEHQTELRYRGLIDIANQSTFDEKRLNIPGVKNIDHIQWVLGTHHVHNRQDAVHYLLLQSKADQKLYLVALVQPMSANLTQPDLAFDALQIVVAEHPINDVLATNALWHGDTMIDAQGNANQLILSWVNANTQQEQSVYVDPNQLKIQHQTYSLTASNSDNGAKSYQLQAISEKVAFRSEHIKLLENSECIQSSTYSYGGHLSLRLINPPDSVDDQLGVVVSTTDRCELIRAMDPYHRGKTDRLLVRNHRDQLSAWRYSHVSSSMSDQPFEFYMDFTSGTYQASKTQSSLESAAYQYPLSQSLQSQNLSFDETDEQYLRQKMLRNYCAKENIDDKECLYQWLKNALQTDSNASQYSECDAHNALNNAMINCIRTIVLAKLNQLPHGTNLESSTHKFEFTNDDGDSILKRTNLSTKNTDHINVNNLFDHLFDTLSLTQQGTDNQLNNLAVKQPIWTDLVASTINTFIPPAHAGAEVVACLALGPFAPECIATDLILSVAVVAFVASGACEISEGTLGGEFGYQLCKYQKSHLNAEQKVAQHIPAPIEPEHKKNAFEQRIQDLIKDSTKDFVAGQTAAKACSLLAEAALLDPEPGTKTVLSVVDGVCWISLMVTSYSGDKYYEYRLDTDNQRLDEQTHHSDNHVRTFFSGLTEAVLIRVTNEGIASNTADFSSTNNSQIKPCKDNIDLCLDDTLRIRESDDGTVEVISLSTDSVNPWWHGQLGKNEVTGLPQLILTNIDGNDKKILTYDVIKKDKQGNSILGLTSLKRTDHMGIHHFQWTYNAFGQVISVVSGIENASEEFYLVSSWAWYHQPMEDSSQPLLDFVIRYDNQYLNGGIDMQASEHYRFQYTQNEGHQHQLHEIKKIVGREVTGYLKLGASASKSKPLAEIYKPCDSNNSRCYAIDRTISDPPISRTYAIPARVYEPNIAMWLPVLGFTVSIDGIKLKTLSPTSASLCPTQYMDINAPGNDLWDVTDFSHVQIPQPLEQLLSGSVELAKTYYFKGTQIALASMANALVNRSALSDGVGKVMEEMQNQSIEIKNKDDQWTNVSTFFNATADESESESETQNEPNNQAGNLDQDLANLAELLGLQTPQINSPIGEIDENTSVEQLAELLCPVSSSPNGDDSPNNGSQEVECDFEEPESDQDQFETENLQEDIPSLPFDVLMEYIERDPQGFRDEMQRVIKELQDKLSEIIKVNGSHLNFDSQAYSRTDSSGRRRLEGEEQSNNLAEHKVPSFGLYPLDMALALYFKIPKNTRMLAGERIEIAVDRPIENPTRYEELLRKAGLNRSVDGTNFYKGLVTFRPIEFDTEKPWPKWSDRKTEYALVFDAKRSVHKWGKKINPDDPTTGEYTFVSHEFRFRQNIVLNLNKLFSGKHIREWFIAEEKISYELTLGTGWHYGDNEAPLIKEFKWMAEIKADVGHSVKITNPEAWDSKHWLNSLGKIMSTLMTLKNISVYASHEDNNERQRVKKLFCSNFFTYPTLLVSMLPSIFQNAADNNFSSIYILGSLQPIFDIKKSDLTSFEFRYSPAAKYNMYGNLDPAESGFQDD